MMWNGCSTLARIWDLGFDRFQLVAQAVQVSAQVQRLTLAWRHRDIPDDLAFCFRSFGRALVAGVTEGFLLIPMQQCLRLRDVVDVGRGADHGIYKSRLGIDADVRLHAEMPLVTFLGLMHLGISLSFPILGPRWSGNDRGVDDGAFAQHQAFLGKVCFDRREDALGQFVLFQKMLELEKRRCIRCAFPAQVDADKVADRVTVVQGVLDPFVGQSERLLHDVHAQHPPQSNWRPTAPLALRVVRRQRAQQIRPRCDDFEFAEQPLALGHLALGCLLQVRKALLHRVCP